MYRVYGGNGKGDGIYYNCVVVNMPRLTGKGSWYNGYLCKGTLLDSLVKSFRSAACFLQLIIIIVITNIIITFLLVLLLSCY